MPMIVAAFCYQRSMALTVFWRFMYDDVRLLASVDPDSSAWSLTVDGATSADAEAPRWVPIEAKIVDEHLNWSTADLTHWDGLRKGDPSVIDHVFPEACPGVPVGLPMAVMWNVSAWTFWTNPRTGEPYRFRFTDPHGSPHEFEYANVVGAAKHPFQIGK